MYDHLLTYPQVLSDKLHVSYLDIFSEKSQHVILS